MIQELLYLDDENTERCFSNPRVILKENKRLQESEGMLRVLGTERTPDPTTACDFLIRFH